MLFKHYTIYKTTNNITSEIYIGSHKTNNINDSYKGSGSLIKIKLKEYGRANFTKEILFDFDNPEDMSNKEREIVNDDFVKNTNNYNLRVGGGSRYDRRFIETELIDNKILSLLDNFTLDEICEKLEIKHYRVFNCLVKNGMNRDYIYQKPKISEEDKKFIKNSYKEVRSSSLSNIIGVSKHYIDDYIETVEPGFMFKFIYKKDLINFYIRMNYDLKEIAIEYDCSQANLTSYMKDYNIYEIKKRFINITMIRNVKNNLDMKRKDLFRTFGVDTKWLVKYKIYLKKSHY